MRRLIIALMGALILASQTASVSAGQFNGGFYTNSAIADGTLSVCFAPGSIYNYRTSILHGLNEWGEQPGGPITLSFYQNPVDALYPCNTTPAANVIVRWASLNGGVCADAASAFPPNGGSVGEIWVNLDCEAQGVFYWGYSPPVPTGKEDIYTIMAHEMGHALGLDHTSGAYHLMSTNAIGNPICPGGTTGKRIQYMSADDGNWMRARYPGLATTGGFPTSNSCIE